jgi:Cdc6-like AAA superfamily ATPase
MKYNLDVLNDKEFEDLCKDLLDVVYKVDFQIFKAGKDGGIDLLYAGNRENEIVVQVKHYVSSSFSQLKQKLLHEELENLKKMVPEPGRYVVATSLPLSPQQSKEIQNLLIPFVHSTDDVFGRRRLESILSKHPQIEEKFFKLWLTSTNVMRRILNNAIVNNSNFHKEQILNKTKRYVINEDFSQAVAILLENKFLIVTGLPGVGKTTLAYMLICERLASGCELIFSDGKISEVEVLLSHDPKVKQIFFIDDFLGANLYDIQNPKNTENKIISFVSKIQGLPNKYLIFTSRTTILNQANYRFENLRRSRVTTDSKYELELRNYSSLQKAKILYNHLYFNSLDSKFVKPFYEKEIYTRIIKHKNFYPRLIEFITDKRHYNPDKYSSVEDFVFYQLDHPEEIWKHAFEQQLDNEDRFLIMSLFSLGANNVEGDILETAFTLRYEYEIAHNNQSRKPLAYHNSLKKVLDGFVQSSYYMEEGKNKYSFLNPSINDFLLGYLKNDKAEQKSLLSSIAFIDQLVLYFGNGNGKIPINSLMRLKIFKTILVAIDEIQLVRPGSLSLNLLDALFEHFPSEITKEVPLVINLMKNLLDNSSGVNSSLLSLFILQLDAPEFGEMNKFVKHNLYHFTDIILDCAEESIDLENISEIFEQFSKEFRDYILEGDNKSIIESKLSTIFESLVNDMDFDEGDIIAREAEMGRSSAIAKVDDDIWDKYVEFVDSVNLCDYFDDLDHSIDVSGSDIVDRILENINYDNDDDRGYGGGISTSYVRPSDEWDDIDRLFS